MTDATDFWPDAIQGAISLTFDDNALSQLCALIEFPFCTKANAASDLSVAWERLSCRSATTGKRYCSTIY